MNRPTINLKLRLTNMISANSAAADLISKIPEGKDWRESATAIIIELLNEKKYIRWLLSALFGINVFMLGLLLKVIWGF